MEENYVYNRTRERVGALLLIALGLYGYMAIGHISADSRLFPRIVSSIIILCSAFVLLRSFRARSGDSSDETRPEVSIGAPTEDRGAGTRRVAIAALMSVLYLLVVPVLGFVISTTLFMIGSAVVFGYRNWPAIGLTILVYVGFMTWVLRRVFYILLPEPLLNL